MTVVMVLVRLPELVVGQAPDRTDMKIGHRRIQLNQIDHGAGYDVRRRLLHFQRLTVEQV